MKTIFKHFLIAVFLISILTLPYFVFANPMSGLEDVARNGGYATEGVNETSFASTLGTIIKAFLGFLGIIFIILMIWAGYNWMTAGGNEDKVSKARTTIVRAIIGLIITVSSYAIWYFIFARLMVGTS